MADAEFQLVTSLKMETGCLHLKVERLSVLMETDTEISVALQHK